MSRAALPPDIKGLPPDFDLDRYLEQDEATLKDEAYWATMRYEEIRNDTGKPIKAWWSLPQETFSNPNNKPEESMVKVREFQAMTYNRFDVEPNKLSDQVILSEQQAALHQICVKTGSAIEDIRCMEIRSFAKGNENVCYKASNIISKGKSMAYDPLVDPTTTAAPGEDLIASLKREVILGVAEAETYDKWQHIGIDPSDVARRKHIYKEGKTEKYSWRQTKDQIEINFEITGLQKK